MYIILFLTFFTVHIFSFKYISIKKIKIGNENYYFYWLFFQYNMKIIIRRFLGFFFFFINENKKYIPPNKLW